MSKELINKILEDIGLESISKNCSEDDKKEDGTESLKKAGPMKKAGNKNNGPDTGTS